MIKKLEPYQSSKTSIDGYSWEWRPNLEDVINKVNEIIDAVNANSLGFSMPLAYSRFPFLGVDPGDIKKDESVRHGHWVTYDDEGWAIYKCSNCGKESPSADTYYCPMCGALMDKQEKK